MYWVSHGKHASDRLVQLASDLVFEGRDLGTGSEVFGAKFELMNSEEKSCDALAVSGWRTCIFLAEYLERVTAEGRIADAKTPGEKLMKAMILDCTHIQEWNADTLSRYLQVGRRVAEEKVKRWLVIWETMYKGDALLDGIMLLRACVGVPNDDDELARLLQTLFLARQLKDKRSPASVFKAYILRARAFVHLRMCFPMFADVVDQYSTVAFFLNEYGVDEHGNGTDGHCVVPDDDEDQDGDSDDNAEDEAGITTYKSRRMLIA